VSEDAVIDKGSFGNEFSGDAPYPKMHGLWVHLCLGEKNYRINIDTAVMWILKALEVGMELSVGFWNDKAFKV